MTAAQPDLQSADALPEVDRAVRRSWLGETRLLLALAGPLVVTQLAQMAILTTDVILLGRLSTQALAAGAIGNTVYFFCWLVGQGPASAVAPMVAQVIGARPNDRANVRAITRMGLWAAVGITVPLGGVLWLTDPILRLLGQDAQLAADAGELTAMISLGLPFMIGFLVLRNFATAVGRPQAALWVMLAAILVNAALGWTLIFGRFGFPAMGMRGAGLATALSGVFEFVALLAFIYAAPGLRAYRILHRLFRPAWSKLGELFRLGVPIGLTMLFEAMLFNAATLVTGSFGETPLAAHQVALNFASFTFMVPLGVAMAATVRVGVFAGAGDAVGARRAGLTAMVVGAFAALPFALAMLVAGPWIAGQYIAGRAPADLAAIALAAVLLKVAAAFQVADALQVVGAMSLRGLKDTRTPMLLAAASYWLVGAPLCLLLGITLKLGALGVWIGLAGGLAVAAVLMCGRFYVLTRRQSSLGVGSAD